MVRSVPWWFAPQTAVWICSRESTLPWASTRHRSTSNSVAVSSTAAPARSTSRVWVRITTSAKRISSEAPRSRDSRRSIALMRARSSASPKGLVT